MKKSLKRSLSLLSAGLFLLNSNFALVNNRVLAVDPPAFPTKSDDDGRFADKFGKIYKLGRFIGRGNQAMTYACTDASNIERVVKIPLDEFVGKDLGEDGLPKCEDVLNILRRPAGLGVVTMPDAQAEITSAAAPEPRPVPPPTPRKAAPRYYKQAPAATPQKSSDASPRPVPPPTPRKAAPHYSQSVSVTTPQKSSDTDLRPVPPPTPQKRRKVGDTSLNLAATTRTRLDFRDSDSEHDSDDNGEILPIDFDIDDEDANLFLVKKSSSPCCSKSVVRTDVSKSSSSSDVKKSPDSHKVAPVFCTPAPAKEKSLPKPNEVCMHPMVMDTCVMERLGDAPCTVRIFSDLPHIEEFLGQTLMQSLIKNQFPHEPAAFIAWAKNSIFRNILTSLAHFHGRKIYHRDIKSDNIFINKIGEAVVGDLGAARVSFDATRECIGTPGYMAPELLSSVIPRDPAKSDVFGFGITALEVLTDFDAKAYFKANEGNREKEDIRALIDKLPLRVKDERGNILHLPGNWKAFLYLCLNPNFAERATAQEAIYELSKL